jgi:hypothetical protein
MASSVTNLVRVTGSMKPRSLRQRFRAAAALTHSRNLPTGPAYPEDRRCTNRAHTVGTRSFEVFLPWISATVGDHKVLVNRGAQLLTTSLVSPRPRHPRAMPTPCQGVVD